MNSLNDTNNSPTAEGIRIGHKNLSFFHSWLLLRYREVLIVLGLNILALGFYVFNISYGTDDYCYLFKPCNLIASGRWVSHFIYNYLLMNNYLPLLSPLIGMTVMALAGFELTRLWQIRSFFHRILVIGIFSLYPYVLDMYCYRINVVTVPWAYFLAVLALNQQKGWISSILFCISLGVYQATLGVAVCAWLMALLFRLHANEYRLNKPLLRWHFKGWGWILLGILGYFLIMKITLLGGHANLRIEEGFFGDDPIRNFLKYGFILLLRLSFIPEYVIPLTPKIGIFLCVILGTGIILIQSKLRWWVAIIVLILPFAAIAHMLPLANPSLPWRVSFGLIVLVAGFLAMILQHKKLHNTGLILGLFLIVSFIIVDNARMFEQYIRNHQDIAMANQIACRIESLPAYIPGMKFIIVGDTSPASLTWNREFSLQQILIFTRYCSQNRFGLAGCFEAPWSKYGIFINYLQLPLSPGSSQEEKTAQEWIRTEECRPWPHSSSVFIADDAVILYLDPS